jgi:hypothetical protein
MTPGELELIEFAKDLIERYSEENPILRRHPTREDYWLAKAYLAATARLEATERVVAAAREWADSTRVWPPDGDDDRLNDLLEAAQDFYNKTLPCEGLRAMKLDALDAGRTEGGE